MKKRILLCLMGGIMLFGLFGCRKKDGDGWLKKKPKPSSTVVEEDGIVGSDPKSVIISEDASIEKMEYSYAATYIGGIYTYSVLKTDEANRLEVVYMSINEDNPYTADVSDEDMKALTDIVRRYDMGSWDGYHKSNTNVLDGSSFSILVGLNDGTSISASGSNCGPKDYRAACREIVNILQPYIHDDLVKAGIIDE